MSDFTINNLKALDADKVYQDKLSLVEKAEKNVKDIELDLKLNLIKLNYKRRLFDIMKIALK